MTKKFIDPSVWDAIPDAKINMEKYPARGYPYPTPKDMKGATVMIFDGKEYPSGEVTRQNGRRIWVAIKDKIMQAVWDAGEGLYVPA